MSYILNKLLLTGLFLYTNSMVSLSLFALSVGQTIVQHFNLHAQKKPLESIFEEHTKSWKTIQT